MKLIEVLYTKNGKTETYLVNNTIEAIGQLIDTKRS